MTKKDINLIVIFLIFSFFLAGCSLLKREDKVSEKKYRSFPVDTVAKPDKSLRGIKVSLPKPVENKTWLRPTSNEANLVSHPLVGNKIKFAWKSSIGKGVSKLNPMTSQPVTDESNIFTIDSEATVKSFNKNNGKRNWSKKLKKKIDEKGIVNGGLSIYGDSLLITTGFGNVFILDKKNGEIKWNYNLDAPIRAAPIVSSNTLLVLAKDNRLYAFNLENKEIIWTHEGLEEISTFMGSSSPAVSKGIVVVTYSSGEVYGLNIKNGEVIWNTNLGLYIQKKTMENISDIRGNPVIYNNFVYVISYNGKMVSINLDTGKKVWESNIGGMQTPWVVPNFVYVLSKNNELICLSSLSGKVLWVSKLKESLKKGKNDQIINWTGPLLAGRMLILTGSHGLIASISPYSGKFLGAINVKSSIDVQAIVSSKTVYFLTSSGDLLAYR